MKTNRFFALAFGLLFSASAFVVAEVVCNDSTKDITSDPGHTPDDCTAENPPTTCTYPVYDETVTVCVERAPVENGENSNKDCIENENATIVTGRTVTGVCENGSCVRVRFDGGTGTFAVWEGTLHDC